MTCSDHRSRRLATVALAAALLSACGTSVRPRASDTGYTGTWARDNPRIRSMVAIARSGEAYRYRVSVASDDGRWTIRCDWDGACIETVDGRRVEALAFATSVDPVSGRLRVDCHARALVPERKDYRVLEEIEVLPGGKRLAFRTLERDGVAYPEAARPRREFVKVADVVAPPPPENPR